MAINLYCPKCRQSCKLNTVTCRCGNSLKKNRQYKVRVKLPTGKWKSKTVPTLEMAYKVEAKFKTQAVEQDVFNIHRAPYVNEVWTKYLQWAKLDKRTWLDDEIPWTKHIAPHLKGLRLDKITPEIVQAVITGMSTKLSPKGSTYASYLASSGKVDIYTLKELLGHSTLEMTQRYAHLVNGALQKAVNVADEVF